MKITIVCEKNFLMESEEGKRAYPEGMDNCLASVFRAAGHETALVRAGEDGVPDLDDALLESTDVLVWWAHVHHGAVADDIVEKAAMRVLRGMGLIVLHSAHFSKIFKRLLGTSCSLTWREDGELERLWCVDPAHPVARGLGGFIDIPQEEMYGEPFDIPVPDELVYVGWFEGGEVFRGGCVFNRGRGRIFYFNPGHETYPTYHIPAVRRLLVQAAEYVAPRGEIVPPIDGVHRPGFSVPLRGKRE